MNQELKSIFDEDQQECLNPPPDNRSEHKAMRMRIKARVAKMQSIIETDLALSG